MKISKIVTIFCVVLGTGTDIFADISEIALIPQPAKITQTGDGVFNFTADLSFAAEGECRESVEFFAGEIRKVTGWKVPVKKSGTVIFKLDPEYKDGYSLTVDQNTILAVAGDTDNLFYAFQTLRQLAPPAIFAKTETLAGGWSVPVLKIVDAPRYKWRGILVDVSRHFRTVPEMKQVLNSMSMAKLNILHWHLTDSQGWRPEIKGYPKLTLNKKESYTQSELRDIVKYAQQRGITIVPEFDVPGHSGGIAKAYPELCIKKPGTKRAIGLCDPSNPDVYTFIDTVMKEMSTIFTGPYIHFGADEVGMKAWNNDEGCVEFMKQNKLNLHGLHDYFVTKVAESIKKYGKIPVAWDEASNVKKIPEDMTFTSWRGMEPGIKTAREGYNTVMCPVSAVYYDRANSRSSEHPAGYSVNTVTLDQSYFFEPCIPFLKQSTKDHIIGAEGCVWGEKIQSGNHLLSQIMLRGAGLGEALWSPRTELDWNSFLKRLTVHRKRLDAANIAYWWEASTTAVQIGAWKPFEGKKEQSANISSVIDKPGYYEVLFHYTTGAGTIKLTKVDLLENGKLISSDEHSSVVSLAPRAPNQFYILQVKDFKKGAEYKIRYSAESINGASNGVIVVIPALEESRYDKGRSPYTGKSNRNTSKKAVMP